METTPQEDMAFVDPGVKAGKQLIDKWKSVLHQLHGSGSHIECNKLITIAARSHDAFIGLNFSKYNAPLEFTNQIKKGWVAGLQIIYQDQSTPPVAGVHIHRIVQEIEHYVRGGGLPSVVVVFCVVADDPADIDPFRQVSDAFHYITSPNEHTRRGIMQKLLHKINKDPIGITSKCPLDDPDMMAVLDATTDCSRDHIKGFMHDAVIKALQDGVKCITPAFLKSMLIEYKGAYSIVAKDCAFIERKLLKYAGLSVSSTTDTQNTQKRSLGWGSGPSRNVKSEGNDDLVLHPTPLKKRRKK